MSDFVPERQNQSHLLLLVFDGQLEATEHHLFGAAVVHARAGRVVVEDDVELPGAAGLFQQVDGKVLALARQLLVVHLELVLQLAQPPQFHAQLEAGEDGVLAGQRDERRAGQRFVGVDA